MQVEVDDQHRPDKTPSTFIGNRQGDVVPDTKTGTVIGVGMVVTAAEVDSEPPPPGEAYTHQGATGLQTLEIDQPFDLIGRHLETQDRGHGGRLLHSFEVFRRMHQRQRFPPDRLWPVYRTPQQQTFGSQKSQNPVGPQGVDRSIGKGGVVFVVVNDLERRGPKPPPPMAQSADDGFGAKGEGAHSPHFSRSRRGPVLN